MISNHGQVNEFKTEADALEEISSKLNPKQISRWQRNLITNQWVDRVEEATAKLTIDERVA